MKHFCFYTIMLLKTCDQLPLNGKIELKFVLNLGNVLR